MYGQCMLKNSNCYKCKLLFLQTMFVVRCLRLCKHKLLKKIEFQLQYCFLVSFRTSVIRAIPQIFLAEFVIRRDLSKRVSDSGRPEDGTDSGMALVTTHKMACYRNDCRYRTLYLGLRSIIVTISACFIACFGIGKCYLYKCHRSHGCLCIIICLPIFSFEQ